MWSAEFPTGLGHEASCLFSLGALQAASREAENQADEEYGLLRLGHFLRQFAESLLDDVRSFADGSGLRDDASVIFSEGLTGFSPNP